MERIKHKIRCDDTMTKCDGMLQRNRSVTDSYSAVYHHKGDDNDKKLLLSDKKI